MTRRAIVALGAAQCVNWGVLYYAFGVLLLPMQRDLATSQPVVAGAFSLALLVSAAAAPAVGRLCDAGKGPSLMRISALAAGVLLWILASLPHVVTLYVVWAGLGICMAAALYEPAFAIVGRALASPRRRLRALSIVTVFGGLASTVFLPMTAILIDRWGWRGALAALGACMAASAAIASALSMPAANAAGSEAAVERSSDDRRTPPLRLRMVMTVFALASFAGAAFMATAVTAFMERGITATRAALLAGIFGVMQLPGRLFMMTGLLENPSLLAGVSLAAQAAGLMIVAIGTAPSIAAGVALFAIGNGLMTLVRPHLVHSTFEIAHAGARNGAIARAQQVARAAGPFVATLVASALGYRAMLGMLALGVTALAAWWWSTITAPTRNILEETI